MKRMLLALGLAATFCACGSDSTTSPSNNQNVAQFTANLLASNEVPPTAGAEANARGSATITFNLTRDGSGNITASDVAGTTTAKASSGDVNARSVSGNVDVETGSGTIEVALMTPASIKATTGSGDVTLAVAEGRYRVVATTGSGDQHITVPNDPSAPNMLEAHTGSGQITIRPS